MMKKKSRFPRLVKWMFLTGIILLIFMTLARLIFFNHFAPLNYSFSNSSKAIFMGLRFDLRIVCGILLFPLLIGSLKLVYKENNKLTAGSIIEVFFTILIMVLLIIFIKKGHASTGVLIFMSFIFLLILVWLFITKNCDPFKNEASKKIFKIYFFIVSLSLVLLYVIDFEHYDYLHERLNAGVLNYAADAKISAGMVWQTYPVLRLLLILVACTAIIYYFISRWQKKIKGTFFKGPAITRSSIIFLFALLLGLGIFGRLNQYPLRWSDAFSFDDNFKANLALNPVQSFLSTFEFKDSKYDIDQVRAYYPLMAQYLNITKPDSANLNYSRAYTDTPSLNPPNVVVVICESFSAYKSSMWGNPLNTTPYFNELCNNGIFFDRCFTPSYGTARGVWATVTGIPDVEYPNTSSRNPKYVSQHTIINDYTGYNKFYLIGGSSSWANIRGLFTNNIDGLRIYEENDFKAKSVDVWGISDKRLFLEANTIFSEQKKPFFAIVQTADNHRPYTIPEEDKKEFELKNYPTDTLNKYGFASNDELNAFRYTDFSFQKFIEAAKKEPYFNNTIFVFVGDHGIRGNSGNLLPEAWAADGLTIHHVPLLFYSPALLKPQKIDKTCSQADLLPSVTALAKIQYTNTTLGRNLFDTSFKNDNRFKDLAFIFDPGIKQIGIVTDDYCYVHNLLSGKEDFRSSKNNLPLSKDPATETDKKSLQELAEAYYETAKYMLANNKKLNEPNP